MEKDITGPFNFIPNDKKGRDADHKTVDLDEADARPGIDINNSSSKQHLLAPFGASIHLHIWRYHLICYFLRYQ